jgi:hypothetical protein
MAFPLNPTNGQTANVNGVLYTYSSALTAWGVTSSGGALTTASSVSATGNISGAYIIGDGSQLTGLPATYGNANVVTLLAGFGSNTVSTTGNVAGGNLTTGGQVVATSNVSGGNVTTSGVISATGNVYGNNISSSTAFVTKTILETVTVNGSAFASPSNYDVLTQSVWYSTAAATANITLNIRGNSSVSANTMLSVGQSMTFALMITNTGTAYYPSAFQVDGASVTPKYQGGTAFSSGNANSTDIYSFTLIKTAATPTYTLLASQTKFA